MIIDIHTHTYPTSVDSFIDADELIEEAKRIGLDGVCITDHDGFWDHREVEDLSKRHNFLVLPGCEVTTEEGHVLVYGLRRYIFGMHRAGFVKDKLDRENGAMVVAHPYRRTYRKEADINSEAYREMLERASRNDVFDMVNAVELLNGRGSAGGERFQSRPGGLVRAAGHRSERRAQAGGRRHLCDGVRAEDYVPGRSHRGATGRPAQAGYPGSGPGAAAESAV